MARYNLPRVFTVTDDKKNTQGFGPGECDVPEWAVKQLKERGRDIEPHRIKGGAQVQSAPVNTPAATPAATPEKP